MAPSDQLVTLARTAVRLARIANRCFLIAVGVALPLSWVLGAHFTALVATWIPGTDVVTASAGFRLVMLMGITMALLTEPLLRALGDILRSVQTGDPFSAGNVPRLRMLGGCLLGLQLLEIPGALIGRHYPEMGSAAPSGDVSIAGWLAVLMVFVLSEVYHVGTSMRDDLDGTV
jgi:hypothetical protein